MHWLTGRNLTARMTSLLAKAPLVLEAALVLLLLWIVGGWFMPETKAQAGVAEEAANAVPAVLPDVAELVSVPLFGERPSEPARAPQPAKPAVQLPLNIKLLGGRF